MIYNQFDVVIIPFPFTDAPVSKRRPALVLSSGEEFNKKIDRSIMAMITSTKSNSWPLDVLLEEPRKANLPKTCLVRMKLFTIDHILIEEKIGTLSSKDIKSVQKVLKSLFF